MRRWPGGAARPSGNSNGFLQFSFNEGTIGPFEHLLPGTVSPSIIAMRALHIACLAALVALASPAHAVMLGTTTRDPDGTRGSVVRVENSMGELCSGALIAPDLVLTAAHCLTDRAAYRVVGVDRAFRPRQVRRRRGHPSRTSCPERRRARSRASISPSSSSNGAARPRFRAAGPAWADRVATGDMRRPCRVRHRGRRAEAHGPDACARPPGLARPDPGREPRSRRRRPAPARGDDRRRRLPRRFRRSDPGAGQAAAISSSASSAGRAAPLAPAKPRACGGLTAVTPVAEHLRWIVEGAQALNQFTTAFAAPVPPPPAGARASGCGNASSASPGNAPYEAANFSSLIAA